MNTDKTARNAVLVEGWKDQEGWDEYWINEAKNKRVLYNKIAEFYRKYLIKNTLNHFMRKHFLGGAGILHAGCGGGQVDADLVKEFNVTAIDISAGALLRYKKLYGKSCRTVQGSILEMPFDSESFDGIYNLGVMEHFTAEDIQRILVEFRRVLKPQGKIVLFWPPEFGLSVTAFKVIYFIFNTVLRRNLKLCPDEITRILSRSHAQSILGRAGFKMADYYFGPKDAFTYCVIVAQKS